MGKRLQAVLTCLSVLASLTVFQAVAAEAATPGGVFVTGHDPDFHALSFGENPIGAQNIIKRAVEYVTFNQTAPSMLLVTSRIAPPAGHRDSAAGLTATGYTFDTGSAPGGGGDVDLSTVDFADYDVVVVASDFGGILTQAELDILNARSSELIDYVNGGGGLVAFAETNGRAQLTPDGGHFDFLPFLASEEKAHQDETNYDATPFGESIGLTDSDVNGNVSHNIFLDTGGMNIVDVDDEDRILSLAIRGVAICTGGVPSASIDDVAQNEGTGATPTSFTFTVSLSTPVCGDPATVDFGTFPGTAEESTDYAQTTGSLTFPQGESSLTVTVPVAADSSFEPDETFFVRLSDPVNMTIADDEGLGTIINDDPQNGAPDCSTVAPSQTELWPPNHKLQSITLSGASDPDGDPTTLTITTVTQDEPLNGTGDGDTSPDAKTTNSPDTVLIRAERAGPQDGRVYRIGFMVTDSNGGSCTGTVFVTVPKSQGLNGAAVDSGATYNSFGP